MPELTPEMEREIEQHLQAWGVWAESHRQPAHNLPAAERWLAAQRAEIVRLTTVESGLETYVTMYRERITERDAEISRLKDDLASMNGRRIAAAVNMRRTAEAQRDTLLRENERLRAALRDVCGSPAEFDDSRIGYVTLQIDRGDLGHAQALLASPPPQAGDPKDRNP